MNGELLETFDCIILSYHEQRAFWTFDESTVSGGPPDCASEDSIQGYADSDSLIAEPRNRWRLRHLPHGEVGQRAQRYARRSGVQANDAPGRAAVGRETPRAHQAGADKLWTDACLRPKPLRSRPWMLAGRYPHGTWHEAVAAPRAVHVSSSQRTSTPWPGLRWQARTASTPGFTFTQC